MTTARPTPNAKPQSIPTNKQPRNTTIHTSQSGLLTCTTDACCFCSLHVQDVTDMGKASATSGHAGSQHQQADDQRSSVDTETQPVSEPDSQFYMHLTLCCSFATR